ncbi:DNA-binding response regulator [Streptomyces sp. NBC_01408]|uniref:DNA-binding response regulator n=1 Tax=Streptomyces sp. NBC_01408 TaxID=2903855 RepID=UPI0022594CA4|nr:DNA-binding response regulator [Streptomyces sp. NBC_01408]MCX4693590.1 DNA-binding response regulator [Streptomyces sp. NBC_01408]
MPVDHRQAPSLRVLLDPPNPALALRLGLQPDIEVVRDAMARPVVALVEEPGSVARVLADDPECRVLVLTGSARPGLLDAVLASGAAGLILRDDPIEDLADAIRRASRGETVIDPSLGPGRAKPSPAGD